MIRFKRSISDTQASWCAWRMLVHRAWARNGLCSAAPRCYSPRRTPEGAAAAPGMMEKKDEKKREDIRVIDRRMFTSDGQRRDPDLPFEEVLPAPHGVGAAPGPEAPRAAAAPGSRQDQVASAHFVSLVRNLAATAAANLGEMPNPFTGQVEVDLDGARQVIDLLQALQMKTRGNLTADEARLLESLLYDLKIAVVNLQKPKTSKKS